MPEHTPAPTPARSLYGFFLYLFSKTVLGIYFIWAFTPDSFLHTFNIYYYPQKYWSIAIPMQCLAALTMFAFFVYPSSSLILSANIDSISTISDPVSVYTCKVKEKTCTDSCICVCPDATKCIKHCYAATPDDLKENTVPPLHDINIRFVCKKLYFNRNICNTAV